MTHTKNFNEYTMPKKFTPRAETYMHGLYSTTAKLQQWQVSFHAGFQVPKLITVKVFRELKIQLLFKICHKNSYVNLSGNRKAEIMLHEQQISMGKYLELAIKDILFVLNTIRKGQVWTHTPSSNHNTSVSIYVQFTMYIIGSVDLFSC